MSAPQKRLTPKEVGVVRLVRKHGAPTVSELLNDYGAYPMTVDSMRHVLLRLFSRGWLTRSQRQGVQTWSLSASGDAQATLGRFPVNPAADSAGCSAAAARRLPMEAGPYVPPAASPLRAGSTDFAALPSLGPFPITHR